MNLSKRSHEDSRLSFVRAMLALNALYMCVRMLGLSHIILEVKNCGLFIYETEIYHLFFAYGGYLNV